MNNNNFDNYYKFFLLFSFIFAFAAVLMAAFYGKADVAGCFGIIAAAEAAGAYVLRGRKED